MQPRFRSVALQARALLIDAVTARTRALGQENKGSLDPSSHSTHGPPSRPCLSLHLSARGFTKTLSLMPVPAPFLPAAFPATTAVTLDAMLALGKVLLRMQKHMDAVAVLTEVVERAEEAHGRADLRTIEGRQAVAKARTARKSRFNAPFNSVHACMPSPEA